MLPPWPAQIQLALPLMFLTRPSADMMQVPLHVANRSHLSGNCTLLDQTPSKSTNQMSIGFISHTHH